MWKFIHYYYSNKKAHPSTLAFFRITFGGLMFFSTLRFWSKGWIETLYIKPIYHFKYYLFEWVNDLGDYTYILFIICLVSSLFVTLGYKYRVSIITFFLFFTYIELIDKTTYLNHYYLTSCIAFIMCFLPAGNYFSLDSYLSKEKVDEIPVWTIDSIKIFICFVYFFAGIAKLNSDWLIEAQPLSLWLKSKYDLPIIGQNIMQLKSTHYLASWFGMIYDIFIPFFLLFKRTKYIAFFFVIIFHVLTRVFFPSIGMFPYIMISSAVIFFDSKIHIKLLSFIKSIIQKIFSFIGIKIDQIDSYTKAKVILPNRMIFISLCCFLIFQLLFPFRNLLYPGELFWNEQGYRFSWRVMLMEKKGETTFRIKDSISGKFFYAKNEDFLTPFQEKQMSFQPDFILEYAHYLGLYYRDNGYQNIQIFSDSYVALNGRRSQRFIDPNFNLLSTKESFYKKKWILPLNDEIKGF